MVADTDDIKVPVDVMIMRCCPVGLKFLRETILKYPEWCQKEYDQFVKASAIPEEVHESYFEELKTLLMPLEEELRNSMPPSKGILYYVQHPDEFAEWNKSTSKFNAIMEEQAPERKRIESKLHRKYFYEYGI